MKQKRILMLEVVVSGVRRFESFEVEIIWPGETEDYVEGEEKGSWIVTTEARRTPKREIL